MMERDKVYDALIARCGEMQFAMVYDKPVVISYTGGNVLMSQELLENIDYILRRFLFP